MTILRDEIANDPLGRGYAAMTDGQREASLNTKDRTKVVDRYVGYGTVLSLFGATDGAAVLDALETLAASSSPVKWAMRLLADDKLNIGDPATRAQIDALTPAVFTPAQAAALKGLAEQACSRAEELGVSAIGADIRNARA